jgi:hypothetical protein
MRDVRNTLSAKLRPVTIYADDIRRIYKILLGKCKKEDVLIVMNDKETEKGETLDDIINELDVNFINELRIRSSNHSISINITDTYTGLFSSNDSAQDKEVFEKIHNILKPRQVSLVHITQPGSVVFPLIFVLTLVLQIEEITKIKNATTLAIMISMLLWFITPYFFKKRKIAYIQEKYDEKSYLNRHKTIIGFLLTILMIIATLYSK